ncbi:unnamed protein product [Urochloa humidicola]
MLLRLGRVPVVVASSASAAEEAMRARDLDFASRPRSRSAAAAASMAVPDRLLYGRRDVAFAPYGERWRQARRVCVSHLLSARRVESFRRVREQEAAALVARVRDRRDKQDVGNLGDHLVAYANAVVSRAAFGDETARGLYGGGGGRRELVEAVAELHELLGAEPMGELLPWLSWVDAARGLEGRIRRTFVALDGALEKVIDDHRRRPPPPDDDDGGGDHWDFVDVLLDVSKHDEYGIRLETDDIKAIILDMFAAGTNTTNTAMEWAMAELVTHPAAMRRLQDEIRAAVGPAGSDVTVSEDHLDKLPYLKAVIKETLRLHVPAPLLVPRETMRDTELLGYHVAAGTRVLVNAWAIHRDAAAWGQDAEEFVPERFVGSGVDYRGQDFVMLPFGAGRRGCPGIGFAEPTMELALASLMYHFDWEVAGGRALDMSEMNGITVHIKSGLPLVAKPWEP